MFIKTLAALVGAGLLQAPGLSAQVKRLEVTPLLGGAFIVGDLPRYFELQDRNDTPRSFTDARLKDGVAIGGQLGTRVTSRVRFEASGLYIPSELNGVSPAPRLDISLWTLGGRWLARSPDRKWVPFAALGVGAVRYDFTSTDLQPIVNFMWSAGIGLSLEPTHGVTMKVETRDHISRFEAPAQEGSRTRLHAVSLLVGLDLALWHTGGNAQRHPDVSKR